MSDLPEVTPKKQGRAPPFKPGQSGNPAGRPKGRKNKLTDAFWNDFAAAWEKHGKKALETVAKSEPAKFLTVAASVMPKEVNLTATFTEMTDEQLDSRIRQIADEISFGFAGREEGIGDVDDGAQAPSRPH